MVVSPVAVRTAVMTSITLVAPKGKQILRQIEKAMGRRWWSVPRWEARDERGAGRSDAPR
jgi:hypothetical protein